MGRWSQRTNPGESQFQLQKLFKQHNREPTQMETDDIAELRAEEGRHESAHASCPGLAAYNLLHSSLSLPCPKGLQKYKSLAPEGLVPFKLSYLPPPPAYHLLETTIFLSPPWQQAPAAHVKGPRSCAPNWNIGINSLALFPGGEKKISSRMSCE